jgi:hypothetical protein
MFFGDGSIKEISSTDLGYTVDCALSLSCFCGPVDRLSRVDIDCRMRVPQLVNMNRSFTFNERRFAERSGM